MITAAWLTAAGTLALAVAAVWVALWSDKRTGQRLETQQQHNDRQLTEERRRHEAELADERAHSEKQLASQQESGRELLAAEQAFSRAQIEEERKLAREREQYAEANAVRVVQAEKLTSSPGGDAGDLVAGSTRVLVAIVVNGSAYTITRVEAQFCLNAGSNRSLVTPAQTERVPGFADLDQRLREGLDGPPQYSADLARLAPWDAGIRYRTDAIAIRYTFGWYPVVRWTDRWGTRWQHKQGDVRQIGDAALWEP